MAIDLCAAYKQSTGAKPDVQGDAAARHGLTRTLSVPVKLGSSMNLIESFLFPLTLGAALSCGLVAGLLFAFSNFIMGALERIQPSAGISAMQSINTTVLNPVFFAVFFGAAVLSLLLVCFSLLRWQHPSSAWLLAGGVLYLVGGFLVTAVCNVPLNEALASMDPLKPESVSFWREYVSRWSTWNHIRTIASLLATAAFSVGLSRPG